MTALLGSALLLEIVTATAIHAVIDMATKRETEGTEIEIVGINDGFGNIGWLGSGLSKTRVELWLLMMDEQFVLQVKEV